MKYGERVAVVADTIIVDPSTVLTDAAVLIAGGRVDALVAQHALDPAVPRVGGNGRVIIPGLIDLHAHAPLTAVRSLDPGLIDATARTGFVLDVEAHQAFSLLGALEHLAAGTTTVVEHYRRPDLIVPALRATGLRGLVGGRIHDATPEGRRSGSYLYSEALADATLTETKALIAALAGDPLLTPMIAPHAPDTCSPALLQRVGRLADETGLAVHIHLAQAAAELAQIEARDGTTPVGTLARAGLVTPRLVGAHGTFLSPEDAATLGAAGAAMVHNPIGNARQGLYARVFSMRARGVRIGLGIDTLNGDLFEAMRQAIVLARLHDPTHAPPAAEAFALATTEAAAILGRDDLGHLHPGAAADLVILDATSPNLAPGPLSIEALVWNATAANVETVLIGGRTRWHRGTAPGIDVAAAVARARASQQRMVAAGAFGGAVAAGSWAWLML
jgi:5-methylthioadenosine/S-adenosylhomocysteine deaminase